MKSTAIIFCILIAFFIVACEEDPIGVIIEGGRVIEEPQTSELEQFFYKSKAAVYNPITNEITGNSFLTRKNDGIIASFKSKDLQPGHAYTLWWRIWNKPDGCQKPGACTENDLAIVNSLQVEMMYAGGQVAEADGSILIQTSLLAGDDSGSINHLFGWPDAGGLQANRLLNAEIHLILRSHGPTRENMIVDQISSYLGGCENDMGFPLFTEIPQNPGECGNIEIAIHPPLKE